MAMLELKETDHSYYCSESNYYVSGRDGQNFGRCEYPTWDDFKEDWLMTGPVDLDDDYNHLFRFDICENEEKSGFKMWLFFILQRKGIYRPVLVHSITTEDIPEIEEFLRKRWEYMKGQWSEFSEKDAEVEGC